MSNGKIAVIGANQGALAFAVFAARAGFAVELFEAKEKGCVGSDWTDDITASTFEKVGLKMPKQNDAFKKRGTSLITPDKKGGVNIGVAQTDPDVPMNRRQLNISLAEQAEQSGAKINYGCRVARLTYDRARVTGIETESGEKIAADLVVDCGGVDSAGRNSLPDFFHIPQRVNPSETFFVRRIFYRRPEETPRPERTNKIYLKHLGERGISWCVLSPDEAAADVLIGRLNGLSDETVARATDDLRSENEIIGEEKIKGGELLRIPVRHPISRMAADGYALVGDSAYMTIPLIGSGMANGIRAAKMLCETLEQPLGDRFSAANLYRYQLRYMNEIGQEHAVLDLVKNWFLGSSDCDLNYLLGSGIITDNMLQATNGESVSLSLGEILGAAAKILKRPQLFGKLIKLVFSVASQSKTVKKMPEKFDDDALWKWQQKYEAAYK